MNCSTPRSRFSMPERSRATGLNPNVAGVRRRESGVRRSFLVPLSALTLAIGGAVALTGVVAAADTAISREIARVRGEAQATVPAEQLSGVLARLDRALPAADAGHAFLALYHLQPAYEVQAAFAFSAASGVTTREQFVEAWQAAGEPRVAPRDRRSRALFVEALAESAEVKAAATYRASLPYAEDDGVSGGLFYLGESHAVVKFAAFCRSLDLPAAGPSPLRRPSLAPELDALEAEILDAYGKAEGTARQPFITISVTLKLARTLDQEGRRPGALLQYLLARLRFAQTRTPAPAGDIRARIAAARTFTPDRDHSIAEFFLQLAEANAGASDTAPLAVAVVADVLPAYRKAVK